MISIDQINQTKENNMKSKMKSKLNLFVLHKKKLDEVTAGTGGALKCCCACAYANSGGSSSTYNFKANDKDNLISPECFD